MKTTEPKSNAQFKESMNSTMPEHKYTYDNPALNEAIIQLTAMREYLKSRTELMQDLGKKETSPFGTYKMLAKELELAHQMATNGVKEVTNLLK
jgi:hypothetical protein